MSDLISRSEVNDVIDELEVYTCGRPNTMKVEVSVLQLQRFINKLKNIPTAYNVDKIIEEQGLLFRLPCEVGSTVYAICTCEAVGTVLDGTLYGSNGGFGTATGYYCPYELSDKCPHTEADDCEECKNIENVFEDTVDYINITECEILIGLKNTNLCVTVDEIGKTVFLTQAEAEAKLKELRCNHD